MIAIDQLDNIAKEISLRCVNSQTVALLQYTSGSTGNPKGVVQLTHGNIINDICNIYNLERDNFLNEAVCWLPLYHDMGIVGGIFMPLYGGIRSTLISTLDFLRNPIMWLRELSNCQGVMSGGPDFAYDLCCQRISDEQLSSLDLSRWKVAYAGAETNHVSTYEAFAKKFSRCGFNKKAFHPCYGLAESTVYVTGASVTEPPVIHVFDKNDLQRQKVTCVSLESPHAKQMMSVGTCFQDHDLLIVDPDTHVVKGSEEIGEIWISRPSVSPGYWNNRALTEKTFRAFTQDGRGPYLRTGDLGFLVDGQLYLYGRRKDIIIVRGRVIPPQDIEWAVAHYETRLRKGGIAAFSVEQQQKEHLIVVAEIKPTNDKAILREIFENIRECISINFTIKVHDIVLIKSKTLPKTTSGKVRRSATRDAYLNKTLTIIDSVQ